MRGLTGTVLVIALVVIGRGAVDPSFDIEPAARARRTDAGPGRA